MGQMLINMQNGVGRLEKSLLKLKYLKLKITVTSIGKFVYYLDMLFNFNMQKHRYV